MKETKDLVKRALFAGAVTFGVIGSGDLTPDSWKAYGNSHQKQQGQGESSSCGKGGCGANGCGGKKSDKADKEDCEKNKEGECVVEEKTTEEKK